jgi:putative FmdB family regulatory protein
MPIYAYKCDSCGFAKDVLQKISDPLLTQCPSCGVAAFSKQVTAAGFQLKGSGWYATDFKGGSASAAVAAPATGEKSSVDSASPKSSETSAKPAKTEAAPAASGGCGTGCACHS